MEEVLQGQALVVDIKSTVITTVGFQPLGGSELGEAGIAANAVNHVPIADLVLDLQRHRCCHSLRTPRVSFPHACHTQPLGEWAVTLKPRRVPYWKLLSTQAGFSPGASRATGRVEWQKVAVCRVGRSSSHISGSKG